MALIGFLVLCHGSGWANGKLLRPEMFAWYGGLRRPSWSPPPWVFHDVWRVLYTLMAVAAWLIWRGAPAHPSLVSFGLLLVLNFLWTWCFFVRRSPGLAVLVDTLLWLTSLATALQFAHVTLPAGALLIPLVAWLSVGWAQNFSVWRLNR
jgi:tryptophan-rich sensory protein